MGRKVVCYIATSADGYIARPDGDFSWLQRHAGSSDQYGYNEFVATVDTIVWGRKTWDQVQDFMDQAPGMGETKSYVFTSRPETGSARPGVEYVNEPVPPFMQRLRAQPGKDIWMMGGGGIIGAFLDANELDEFIVHVIPVLIGEGIPLIAPRHLEVPLRLLDTKRYDDGVLMLHWQVRRDG